MVAKECRKRLSTIQESYKGHMDKMIDELDELERLAKIGNALEKAFEDNSILLINYYFWNGGYEGEKEFELIEDLINWYENL